ncbi:glycosyltransferase [Sphingomonas flavescens]|uniref:glycosyltransferase n=1 Tax=Sphingomonas flavescens TaxID=3132797 RepID=UPI0028052D03|nr:glycosyltransferase [Sphingomonas limnosediminicola]
MKRGPKLLYFFRGDEHSGRPGFGAELERRGWRVDCVPVSDAAALRGIPEVFAKKHDLSEYDVVAASEYFLTWALSLRALLNRNVPAVAALSFNQSSRRLIETHIRPVDWLLNRVWRRVALFVVHSRAEADMFAKVHDIPGDRFVFSHWGYDLPAFREARVYSDPTPYVTMIGRNNRDIAAFCEAVRLADVRGVLVTAGYMLERNPLSVPTNVKILTDRSMEECLSLVAGSFAHLVLVTDAKRGAGHISAVSAMLLGKPQIFTEVPPLQDYLIDGFNGIGVPLSDAQAVAQAICKLRDDSNFADQLGTAGRRFALEKMSNAGSSARMADAIEAALKPGARLA